MLRLWTDVRPDSSTAWAMVGWAHQVDGQTSLAARALRRAVHLDPKNHDAAQLLSSLPASST
jgi:cytochrome c-type biogenesis protein CcmH/NrfG